MEGSYLSGDVEGAAFQVKGFEEYTQELVNVLGGSVKDSA